MVLKISLFLMFILSMGVLATAYATVPVVG